jgi:hypothetical protein
VSSISIFNSKKLKGEWLLKKTGSQTAGRIDSIS